MLHDNDLAETIVDRILERGRLLTLDRPSMRTRHLDLDVHMSEAENIGSSARRATARVDDEHRRSGGGAPGKRVTWPEFLE